MSQPPPEPEPQHVHAPNGPPPAASSSSSSSSPKPSYALSLGTDLSLTIEDDVLLVQDGNSMSNKKSRTCGVCPSGPSRRPQPRSIPLYNILWAELSQDQQTLTVDFADNVSKTQVRAAKLSFPTTSAATADDEIAFPSSDTIAKWISHLLTQSYGPAPRRKRAFVLVNPHAGPGGAQKKWDRQVKPIFDAARMPTTVHITTRAKEAIDLCAGMDIENFDIVVPCSGDGIAYECFNGLGSRPDARRALHKVAVAHVPCGSGNALACNAFGTHRASLAALAIVKGVPTPMDLVSITQQGSTPTPTRSLSFLSQTLGIMAESDLGTEHLRWMGEHRFTYGTLTRILKKKVYPCDLWVKMEIDHKDGVREHYRRERENSSVAELEGTTTSTGTRVGRGSSAGSEAEAAKDGEGLPPLRFGTVGDRLPEGWVKIPADEIGSFYAGNLAYMAPDVIFHSAALISDGLIDIYTVDGAVPAYKVPGLMASCYTNSFLDHSLVNYYKVSAFRIVPKYANGEGEVGCISVDGESIPFEPFQAEVHQGLGMVITKRGVMEAPGPRNWDKVTPMERLRA